MAMTVGQSEGDEDEVVSAINTTPLVDVMLVLLIIFLITVPVVTTSIPVNLPKETNEIRETKPENITISVDVVGRHLLERPADPEHGGADRPAEEGVGADAAAGGPDPRRRRGELRIGGAHHLRVPAGGDRQGRLHHRAAGPRRLMRRLAVHPEDTNMGMNVGTGSGSGEPDVMIDINTTPLIDVMLVLLIMLIITIPIQLHSVNLNMPVGNPPPPLVKPEVVKLDIDGDEPDVLERRARSRSGGARGEVQARRDAGSPARAAPASRTGRPSTTWSPR